MNKVIVESSNFWELDLDIIENTFLPKNKKITDLEARLDDRVAQQGSVLLDKTVNIDNIVSNLTLLQKIKHKLGL